MYNQFQHISMGHFAHMIHVWYLYIFQYKQQLHIFLNNRFFKEDFVFS